MLLDDLEVALDDVLAACVTSAELHEWAAEHADRTALRGLGGHAGARRRDDVQALSSLMRQAGMLPKVPEPESAGALAVLTGLRALLATALTDEDREALRRALDDAEAAIEPPLAQAMASQPPADIGTFLARLQESVRSQRAKLAGV